MDDVKFEKLVGEALDSLPEEFAKKLNNVAVVIEDEPTLYQLRKSKILPTSLLFGLYEGVPQTKRGAYYSALPDKITIFKNSILYVSKTEEDVREQVRSTVIHEIGHHFGLSDEELRRFRKSK
ncbi:MAG: hypothetical protein COU25_02890 [Candidatus Levybacteria bacterium CG10_big_fil_rev_8_21_14_0_10_35_13]|nr:MAG: hypothetical protein COU25_02890 [Candidatus Levybacteria bacterium CG10_big_fil_rev_8_21_14_0_10_35_13]